MDCQLEKEAIEEMESNIIKLNKLLHETLLIQNDLIDQSLLAEEIHREHKGKRIKMIETREPLGSGKIQTEDQRNEKDMDHIRHEEQRIENKDEQSTKVLQEIGSQKENLEQEAIIPPTDSTQWSNITIKKKGKKKNYKFQQTPSNGHDMFALDSKKMDSTPKELPVSSDIDEIWWNMTMSSPIKENRTIEVEDSRPIQTINDKEQQISKLLIKEIISKENQEGKDSAIAEKVIKEKNLEKIGIAVNQEGMKTPICGKSKQKRGRKSLKELGEAAGQVKQKTQILDLLHNGKGKFLPKEQ